MAHALEEAAAAFEETLGDLGLSDQEVGDPAELGRRAALLVSVDVIWRQHLGALFDTRRVSELLGVPAIEVGELLKQGRVLGLPTRRGLILFPAFQFTTAGKVHPILPEILAIFAGTVASPFTIASWFVSPHPLLRKQTPARWLAGKRDPEAVAEAARRSSDRFAR